MLIVEIQHANPYYDDSYAVNSANLGPYGDAIIHELIPYLEKKFRGLGTGWARFMYGGSTGGWEALAAQMFYPDEFNGAYVACPDPIDFRAYTVVNIYEDKNAYYAEGPWKQRAAARRMRNYLGHVSRRRSRQMNQPGAGARHQGPLGRAVGHLGGGLLAGRRGRLSEADLGQAHRRDRQDGRRVLAASTTTCPHPAARLGQGLGQKLEGKLHIYVGDMDNYYLNNAVYLVEDFLKTHQEPALRRRGRLRRPRRALLERRPDAAERLSRGCATTRCSSRRSSSGSARRRRRAPT